MRQYCEKYYETRDGLVYPSLSTPEGDSCFVFLFLAAAGGGEWALDRPPGRGRAGSACKTSRRFTH
jgi:hypothetical protein